jgi:hypothetical protein
VKICGLFCQKHRFGRFGFVSLSGSWFLVAGCWLLVAGYLSLVTGRWFLAAGYWQLVVGLWLLVAGCRSLVIGYWLLIARRKMAQGQGIIPIILYGGRLEIRDTVERVGDPIVKNQY